MKHCGTCTHLYWYIPTAVVECNPNCNSKLNYKQQWWTVIAFKHGILMYVFTVTKQLRRETLKYYQSEHINSSSQNYMHQFLTCHNDPKYDSQKITFTRHLIYLPSSHGGVGIIKHYAMHYVTWKLFHGYIRGVIQPIEYLIQIGSIWYSLPIM